MPRTSPELPGRLGDPNLTIATDPRLDPRLAEAAAGLSEALEELPVGPDSPLSEIRAYVREVEAEVETAYADLFRGLAAVPGVERRSEDDRGGGRSRDPRLHPRTRRTGPPTALHPAHPRRWHGDGRRGRRPVHALAGRARRAGSRGGGRRVPQRGRQARRPSVPGRSRRLCCCDALGLRAARGTRHQPHRDLRRVRWRQPVHRHGARGAARGLARGDRRRVLRAAPTSPEPTVPRPRSSRPLTRTRATCSMQP